MLLFMEGLKSYDAKKSECFRVCSFPSWFQVMSPKGMPIICFKGHLEIVSYFDNGPSTTEMLGFS